jgi:hypothetical protein
MLLMMWFLRKIKIIASPDLGDSDVAFWFGPMSGFFIFGREHTGT